MSWFKNIVGALVKQGDFDEEFILMLVCSLIINKPFLIVGDITNFESVFSCFSDFESLDCQATTSIEPLLQNQPLKYVLVTNLQAAPESMLAEIAVAMASKPNLILCITSSHLWTLPSSILRQIPMSYLLSKPFIEIQKMELLLPSFLSDLQQKVAKVYVSPHISVKIHQIILYCHKQQMVMRYDGSKQDFILGLKALAVILERDFLNESMIPALCEKSMLHKVYYMPDIVWTILPEKRSFIEERKVIVVDAVKRELK